MAIETTRTVVIDGHEYKIERGLYQHVPSGEIYIIETYPDGTTRGICGPLASREVKASELWNYECSPDDAEWAQDETYAEDTRWVWKDIEKYEFDHAE